MPSDETTERPKAPQFTDRGGYSEAWCETCGWRVQYPGSSEAQAAAYEHEHSTLGQDTWMWRVDR